MPRRPGRRPGRNQRNRAPVIDLPDPNGDVAPYREDGLYDGLLPSQVMCEAPFQPGDIVWTMNGTGERVEKAAIEKVFTSYNDHLDEHRPHYRVRPMTKRGTWSANFRHIKPADIRRAYDKVGAT